MEKFCLNSEMELNPNHSNSLPFLTLDSIKKTKNKKETNQNPEGSFYLFWWTDPGIKAANA